MHRRNFLLLEMALNTKRCRIIRSLFNWYESTTLSFFCRATWKKKSHQNSRQKLFHCNERQLKNNTF